MMTIIDGLKISPDYKDIIPLPDYGVGCFLVVREIEIEIQRTWMIIKGTLYTINQDTGEPEKLDKAEIDCPFNVQSIIEAEGDNDE